MEMKEFNSTFPGSYRDPETPIWEENNKHHDMNSDHFVVHPMKSWKDKYTHHMFLRSRILEPARLENGVKCRMDTSSGGWFESVVSVALKFGRTKTFLVGISAGSSFWVVTDPIICFSAKSSLYD